MPPNEGDKEEETEDDDDGDVEHIDNEGDGDTAAYVGEEDGVTVVNPLEYISDEEFDSEQNCCNASALIGCRPFVENGIVVEHPLLLLVGKESTFPLELDDI